MSISRIKIVNFGRNRTGYGGSIGYRLINPGGSETTARTTGMSEIGSGIYFANINFPGSWNGMILWDDGQTTRLYAVETYYHDSLGSTIAKKVWDVSALEHTAADSFGQRIAQIKRESSYRGGVGPTPPVISDEEKKRLFDFLKLTLEKIKGVEEIVRKEIGNFFKPLQKELVRYQNSLTKLSLRIARGEEKNVQRALGEMVYLSRKLQSLEILFQELDKRILESRNLSRVAKEQTVEQSKKTEHMIEVMFDEVKQQFQENFDSTRERVNSAIKLCELLKENSEAQNDGWQLRDKLLLKIADAKSIREIIDEEGNVN